MRGDTGIADEMPWARIQIYNKCSHNLNSQPLLVPNDYNHDDEMIIKTQSELDGAKRLWKKDK